MTDDPRTVPAALDRLAAQLADHEALVTDDRSFTSGELRDEVHRAAAALIALGVQPGDRVAIWSPNTWHWVVACLAIHHAGAAMVPRLVPSAANSSIVVAFATSTSLKMIPKPLLTAGVGCPATSNSTSRRLLPTGEKILFGLKARNSSP